MDVLTILIIILIVLWLTGNLAFSAGPVIHLLLIVVVILLLVRLLR